MQITADNVVLMQYVLTNEAGDELDRSQPDSPLPYLHGHGNIIPGLEKELEGKQVGDSLKVVVSPEEGYGVVEPGLIQDVPREAFQGVDNIEVGMQFEADTDHGPHSVTVTKVEDKTVTVDGNHPLAGETLNFAVEIKDVRAATAEELEHGHVHGPGGHDH